MDENRSATIDLERTADDGALTEREQRFLLEYQQRQRRGRLALLAVGVLLAAAFLISFGVGRYALSPGEVLRSIGDGIRHALWSVVSRVGSSAAEPDWMSGREDTVVWLVRMPRILGAMLVGAALAVSGATYQGLFRNPMVSPDILGASAGASVGACFILKRAYM